tara:strand:- start:2574 stop:3422 length:849 start_codon:yes stop_codon:yes gene_type:complete
METTETTETSSATEDLTTTLNMSPLVNDDLSFSDGYQERIGEYAEGSTFKNISDVFKTNKELHQTLTKVNQEKASLNSTLEELKGAPPVEKLADTTEFKEKLVLPDFPEGTQIDDEVLDLAVKFAYDKGYSPEALADFLAFDIERMGLETEASKGVEFARLNAAKGVIVEAVGEQNYDNTISDAQFASEALGLPLESADLVGQPSMVLALSKLKTMLSEGSLKGASVGGVQITSGGKLSQANDIISNQENPLNAAFHDNSHPQHETAQQTHARLIMESALPS